MFIPRRISEGRRLRGGRLAKRWQKLRGATPSVTRPFRGWAQLPDRQFSDCRATNRQRQGPGKLKVFPWNLWRILRDGPSLRNATHTVKLTKLSSFPFRRKFSNLISLRDHAKQSPAEYARG
jgi:hypothetical protein